MGHIFLGIIFCVIGTMVTMKSEWFFREFGRIEWAEKHLGMEGGSRLFYKLLGILIIFIGFFVIAGLHLSFFRWLAKTLFSSLAQ
ncbi:MAG: hypothetical protein N2259_01690 [Patescibacteria group bacterium]|nr:hypothetical protein [Patescibacteria group bacterium]